PAIARAGAVSGPLAGLRTALSLLGASTGYRPVYDLDADRRRADALAACAAVPTILTALQRLGQGLHPVEPREDLPYAANYLYMLTGSEPEPDRVRAVEQYLISTVDHGFNASTFTARVVASTGAD
ncbi:citrate synthase/methylcitrate synthase, partial [Streptomyces sp. SID8455]|nr:citrate synthase/methylcitrate synthase [Streptomyces sp. SID8455]